MSFNLSIQFNSIEELESFTAKYKNWKRHEEKKKEKQTQLDTEPVEQLKFSNDKRGLHQQAYHNEAKIYQSEHPELSYIEALKYVYKNNISSKNIIK